MTNASPEQLLQAVQKTLIDLSQGNPGALSVLLEALRNGHWVILDWCRQRSVCGAGIWVLYKDLSGCDITALRVKVETEEQTLLDHLRETGYLSVSGDRAHAD